MTADGQPTRQLAPLFTWRSAIADSDLPPTTRHVLLTLSCYMNERGGSAYPGSARIAHDSGLHRDTVKDHLAQATDKGWIRVLQQGGSISGGKRLATEYVASVPGVLDPQSQTTGGPDRSDWGSSPVRLGVQDPPISSLITPRNSRRCIRCQGQGSFWDGRKQRPCDHLDDDDPPAPPPPGLRDWLKGRANA